MKRPDPVIGMVVRYDYLWRSERARGRREGNKDRPCAIVLAANVLADGRQTVGLVPVTHNRPLPGTAAIEIPAAVRKHLGLDDARQWIVVSELNIAAWNDAGFVPATGSKWDYGMLPAKLAAQIKVRIQSELAAGRLPTVNRDPALKPRPA